MMYIMVASYTNLDVYYISQIFVVVHTFLRIPKVGISSTLESSSQQELPKISSLISGLHVR